jgi:hypothetical protein
MKRPKVVKLKSKYPYGRGVFYQLQRIKPEYYVLDTSNTGSKMLEIWDEIMKPNVIHPKIQSAIDRAKTASTHEKETRP